MNIQSRFRADLTSGCWEHLLLCVCRWWASWVTPAAFPHSHSMTSPSHRSTAPWTPLHPMASQPAAASVQLTPPLRRWTAFHRPSPTAPPHTAPPATAWTQLWPLPATSTVSTARVSPASSHWPPAAASCYIYILICCVYDALSVCITQG